MTNEEKNPPHRPKEPCELTKAQLKEILKRYAAGAADIEVIAYVIGIRGTFSKDLFARWLKEEPDFSDTVTRGRLLSEAWWINKGRAKLAAKTFQNGLYALHMSNRFGWTGKTDVNLGGQKNNPVETKDSSLTQKILGMLTLEQLQQLKQEVMDADQPPA